LVKNNFLSTGADRRGPAQTGADRRRPAQTGYFQSLPKYPQKMSDSPKDRFISSKSEQVSGKGFLVAKFQTDYQNMV
jgi:hypothetical protein